MLEAWQWGHRSHVFFHSWGSAYLLVLRTEKKSQLHRDTQPLHSTLLPFTLSKNIKVGCCQSRITEKEPENVEIPLNISSTVKNMNTALHSGVIGLICYSNFKMWSFIISLFHGCSRQHIVSYKSLLQPNIPSAWVAHIFTTNEVKISLSKKKKYFLLTSTDCISMRNYH